MSDQITVTSRALGGRAEPVIVFLPPGYDQSPDRRYPVFYLLHGVPGGPSNYLVNAKMGGREASLVDRGLANPVILAMPTGSPGGREDTEWADWRTPGNAWETYVARDVVGAVDASFRTIASGAGRAIGGLSEGGYGAINIALHHPGEFRVVESWSGYEVALLPKLFGFLPSLVEYNSPAAYLGRVASTLRADGTFFWFYVGAQDPLLQENQSFAAGLSRFGIDHTFFASAGRHTWGLWNAQADQALVVAAQRLALCCSARLGPVPW